MTASDTSAGVTLALTGVAAGFALFASGMMVTLGVTVALTGLAALTASAPAVRRAGLSG